MKQSKKWMLVALALLAMVALPLVGCKNDSVSEQTGGNTEQPATPGTTGGGNQEGETPKNITVTVAGINFTMVGVPGGTVTGTTPSWLGENAHDSGKGVFVEGRTVKLSDFYIGKYEVTQELYKEVMTGQTVKDTSGQERTLNANPSYFTSNPYGTEKQEKRPVESVSWYDAVYFCNALSEKEELTQAYKITIKELKSSGSNEQDEKVYSISSADVELVPEANGYRLPTEAEWEYAARGGKPSTEEGAPWKYQWAGTNDENNLETYAWYEDTPDVDSKTHEVGKKKENSLGIHDMSGNVREWCWDWHDDDPKEGDGGSTSVTDPTGPSSGSYRVRRGGSWSTFANYCSVSSRGNDDPSSGYSLLGFRVVRPAN